MAMSSREPFHCLKIFFLMMHAIICVELLSLNCSSQEGAVDLQDHLRHVVPPCHLHLQSK